MTYKKQTETSRQQAEIFRLIFQKSKICKMFRSGWRIPTKGFKDRKEYQEWSAKHTKKTNKYYKSEKHQEYYSQIKKKKIEQAKGKITQFDLELFIQDTKLHNPDYKLEFDISNITLKSGKPIYWRDFIEQCLFFENPDMCLPYKPIPKPKVRWNSKYQFYELVVENIFPDTNIKDFKNKKFIKKFEELKLKLPGFNKLEPRYRKQLEFDLKLKEIDKEMSYLSDFEKYEQVKEQDLAQEVDGKMEKNIKNKVRQSRLRTKKLLENKE